jgi:hypothetical protein
MVYLHNLLSISNSVHVRFLTVPEEKSPKNMMVYSIPYPRCDSVFGRLKVNNAGGEGGKKCVDHNLSGLLSSEPRLLAKKAYQS